MNVRLILNLEPKLREIRFLSLQAQVLIINHTSLRNLTFTTANLAKETGGQSKVELIQSIDKVSKKLNEFHLDVQMELGKLKVAIQNQKNWQKEESEHSSVGDLFNFPNNQQFSLHSVNNQRVPSQQPTRMNYLPQPRMNSAPQSFGKQPRPFIRERANIAQQRETKLTDNMEGGEEERRKKMAMTANLTFKSAISNLGEKQTKGHFLGGDHHPTTTGAGNAATGHRGDNRMAAEFGRIIKEDEIGENTKIQETEKPEGEEEKMDLVGEKEAKQKEEEAIKYFNSAF